MKNFKAREVLFYPVSQQASEFIDPPIPASKGNVPEWHKQLPKYTNGDKQFRYTNDNNLTAKSCLPLIDGFTSGYVYVLHCDVLVSRDIEGRANFSWAYKINGIDSPVNYRPQTNKDQITGWNSIDGYDDLEFNWFPHWNIKTPPGYSSFFTHPINRIDLPFYTLGGVIDTDGWGEAGNHPFLLKKGFEGLIPAGTPIFQVIPFKRDDWESKVDKTMVKEYLHKIAKRDTFIKSFYKTMVWKNKSYK